MTNTARSLPNENYAESDWPLPAHAPTVIMLTTDRQKIDRRVLQESNSLEAAGWKVTIIGMPMDAGDKEIDPRVIRVSIGVKSAAREARILPVYRWIRRLMPMNAPLMRFMKAFAWRILVDQETFYLKLYEETLAHLKADVFVAHDLPMLPVGRRAANRCGAKLIYDSHELFSEQELTGWEKRRWDQIEAKYIGACDKIVTTNPAVVAEFERRYGVKNVEIVYNAEYTANPPINRKLFHTIFNLPPETKVLLYQGGLSANRHIETLVACMRHVQNRAIHLVVMGDGHLRKKLEKIAVRNRVTSRVHFLDAVPQKHLLLYTASADGGVIPYQATCLNNYVCTPNKMFEFIAAGLPILANDLPEMRKFIAGYDIGLLGNMQTPEIFASLIDQFFSDSVCLDTWRVRALEARKKVCWEEEGKKVIGIYDQLLNSMQRDDNA